MHFQEDPKLEQLDVQEKKKTIVKTTVCQNGGASLLIIDKNV